MPNLVYMSNEYVIFLCNFNTGNGHTFYDTNYEISTKTMMTYLFWDGVKTMHDVYQYIKF